MLVTVIVLAASFLLLYKTKFGAAVRTFPRAVECLRRHRLPEGAEHPEQHLQHAALHHLARRARADVQEVARAEGGGHTLRQRHALASFSRSRGRDSVPGFGWLSGGARYAHV